MIVRQELSGVFVAVLLSERVGSSLVERDRYMFIAVCRPPP